MRVLPLLLVLAAAAAVAAGTGGYGGGAGGAGGAAAGLGRGGDLAGGAGPGAGGGFGAGGRTLAERLEDAELEKSLRLQVEGWTAAFGGNTKLLAAQFHKDIIFCNAVMSTCPNGKEVLSLIDHFVSVMRGGLLEATFVRYGNNAYEFGWKAGYKCKSGAIESAFGTLAASIDPASGKILRIDDLWDAEPFLEAMARCAGAGAPEKVEGAMNPEHLRALLDSDIDSYNTFFEAVSPRGQRPPFAHLDDAVTFCRLGGCGTGRMGFLGELATYRGRIAHLRVTPKIVQVGATSVSSQYFSVVQCRNGYLFSLDGTLGLFVDPVSRKVTRHLDLIDRSAFVTHFSRCK